MKQDSDLRWLKSHLPAKSSPNIHVERAEQVAASIAKLIEEKRLPYTIGLFGTWGSGKTTFLAVLAQTLAQVPERQRPTVVYFNAWKYAGFMEIVPSLIYKILSFGVPPDENKRRMIGQIMISLGKTHAEKVGQWVQDHYGVDPVQLFEDVHAAQRAVSKGQRAYGRLLDSYYTQVDRAQDLLVKVFADVPRATVVLIDELDRCDPDEAFAVIKQLRVFFAMRDVPVLFVMCANPEPIGLAIKHRYGLDSPTSDYEARKILEKFVDTYINMSAHRAAEELLEALWWREDAEGEFPTGTPLVVALDKHVRTDYKSDTIRNASAFQAMTQGNQIYANLRLLRKSLQYVRERRFPNAYLLWTAWHLEMVDQLDGEFRRQVGSLAEVLQKIALQAHEAVVKSRHRWEQADGRTRLVLESEQGTTFFAAYRSYTYEFARQEFTVLRGAPSSVGPDGGRVLESWLDSRHRMDFLALMSLLPSKGLVDVLADSSLERLGEDLGDTFRQYGWLLTNY